MLKPLALLLASWLATLPGWAVADATSPHFSIDPASPAIAGMLGPDDILVRGPAVKTQGTALGMQDNFGAGEFDNLNDFSYGKDVVRRAPRSSTLWFAVDRVAVGAPGSSVNVRARPDGPGAAGSIFVSLPPLASNDLHISHTSLGLAGGFFGDAIDGLELDSLPTGFSYFAIDALSFSNDFGAGTLASTIQVSRGNGVMGLFAGHAAMGLLAGDGIDGLVLDDSFEPGVLNPGRDKALLSLSAFSPSTFTFTGMDYLPGAAGQLSPSDVLFTDFSGSFELWAASADLGLLAYDNITAIDTIPEPATWALMAFGVAALVLWRRRALALALAAPLLASAASVPLFVGSCPPVLNSSGAVTLNDAPATKKTFRWQSVDSVLGDLDSGAVTATTWNYFPGGNGAPPRIVFVGSGGGLTAYGDVLLAPYNRGVVDVVKGGKRIRYLLTPATVLLSVDTNRNGRVEPVDDEAGKAAFTPTRGAVLMVNLDADGASATPDAGDNKIDANGDVDDITALLLQKSGLSKLPAGFEYALRLDKDVADRRARVFPQVTVGATEVIGPGAGAVSGAFKEHVLPAASVEGNGSLPFGMEGITYPAKDSSAPLDKAKNFDGIVDVELALRKVVGKSVIASDKVRLRATPWLMLGHGFKNQEVFVVKMDRGVAPNVNNNSPFITALKVALAAAGAVPLTEVKGSDYLDGIGRFDRWMQDEIEVGFVQSPGAKMHSVFDGPRDGSLNGYPKKELQKKETAAFQMAEVVFSSLNSFGNLEVTPRLTAEGKDWLLGRVYYGSTPGEQEPQKSLVDFLEAQVVQGPVALDSGWLFVGHVDEFISFVPFPNAAPGAKPFKVLLASPKRAFEILDAEKAAGRGGNRFIKPPMETIDALILARKDDNVTNATSWQKRIDGVKGVMKTRFGLVDADFIDVPVVFSPYGGASRASAYLPNMVNLLVVNGHLIPPEPFFAPFKDDFETKMVAVGYKKSGAAGATLHFLDSFIWYHDLKGQVHCGTNSRREIVALPNWWNQQ